MYLSPVPAHADLESPEENALIECPFMCVFCTSLETQLHVETLSRSEATEIQAPSFHRAQNSHNRDKSFLFSVGKSHHFKACPLDSPADLPVSCLHLNWECCG